VTYSDAAVNDILATESNCVDILLTNDWPVGIESSAFKNLAESTPHVGRTLHKLNLALKPRYHFATSETFFEREPYHLDGMITRFISLAPYGNQGKQRVFNF
jgi:hypothetical protein